MGAETQGEAADESATIRSDQRPKTLQPAVPLTSALKAIARFNRGTTWVATGLLGSVVFAAVMVAVRDPHLETDAVAGIAAQPRTSIAPSTNPATDFSVEDTTKKSTGGPTSAP